MDYGVHSMDSIPTMIGIIKKSNILLALIFESSKEKLTLPYLHYLLNQLPLTQFSM